MTEEARIALAGDPAPGHLDQRRRRLPARGEHEQHPGGGVQARVQAAQDGGQHDGVHHVVGVGNAHLGERRDKRRCGHALVVPRHDGDEHEHRAHVEHQDPQDHRVGGFCHGPFRVRGLRRRDGRDLRADHREDHGHDADRDHAEAQGHEPAVARQIGEVRRTCPATIRR